MTFTLSHIQFITWHKYFLSCNKHLFSHIILLPILWTITNLHYKPPSHCQQQLCLLWWNSPNSPLSCRPDSLYLTRYLEWCTNMPYYVTSLHKILSDFLNHIKKSFCLFPLISISLDFCHNVYCRDILQMFIEWIKGHIYCSHSYAWFI